MNDTPYCQAFNKYTKAVLNLENYKNLSLIEKNKGIASNLTHSEIDILIDGGVLDLDFKLYYKP